MKGDRIYNITVTEILKRDVTVLAENSTAAEKRLEEQIRNEEIVLDESDFTDRFLTSEDEKFLFPSRMEKKKLGDREYLFSVIEILQRQIEVKAADKEEAKDKVQDLVRRCDIVLSADDYVERITLEYPKARLETVEQGKQVILYDEDDVTARITDQYPEGVNINLVRESVENLMQMQRSGKKAETGVDFDGLVDDMENRLLVQYGELKAVLKLVPQDYPSIYADENTYYSKVLSGMDYDSGTVAATVMLNEKESMKGQRVTIPVNGRTLERLYIEDVPYKEVMEIINGLGIQKGEENRLASVLAAHREKPLQQRLEKVSIYKGSDGSRYIRCCIDGKQTVGERLKKEDAHAIDNGCNRKLMAAKYFENELVNDRERKASLKR